MTAPFFIADNASVTVVRSVASSVFGKYTLNVPEGVDIDDIHAFDAPGNELGYVASVVPAGKRVGGMARRLVRADVAVTAADPSNPDWVAESTVDRVLREAAEAVASDFFLESDINRPGLGPWREFVDFNVGDAAWVKILGQWVQLPVTRIESRVTDFDQNDVAVHLGGQVVEDSDAREVENESIAKALVEARRDLAGLESQVSKVAETAVEARSTAVFAVGESQKIVESLAGSGASTGDVFEQLEVLSEDLVGQGLPAMEGLLPNYIALNSRLWAQQDELNHLQAEFNERAEDDRAQIRALVGELQRVQSRELLRPVLAGDERWSVSGEKITALGEWTGAVITFGSSYTTRTDSNDGGEIEIRDWYPVYKTRPVPQADGSRTYDYAEAAVYIASEGVQKTRSKTSGVVDVSQGVLTHIPDFDFTATTDVTDMYVSFVIRIDAADRGSLYRIQINVNGERLASWSSSKIGPLTSLGDGYRSFSAEKTGISLKEGDVVTFHYASEGEEASQRRLRSSEVYLSWIEPAS